MRHARVPCLSSHAPYGSFVIAPRSRTWTGSMIRYFGDFSASSPEKSPMQGIMTGLSPGGPSTSIRGSGEIPPRSWGGTAVIMPS